MAKEPKSEASREPKLGMAQDLANLQLWSKGGVP